MTLPLLARTLTVACLAITTMLLGCATDRVQPDVVKLIEQQRYEEALGRLDQASRDSPANAALRAELLTRKDQTIQRLLTAAANELNAGRSGEAKQLYERVLALHASNVRAQNGLAEIAALERNAQIIGRARELNASGDASAARLLVDTVLRESPAHREARTLQRQMDEQNVHGSLVAPALRLKQAKPVNLDFRDANLKMVFDGLSRSTGVNFVFDKDVRGDTKTTIYARQVMLEDAIDLILLTNQLEKKVISENSVLIYPSTQQKLREYQDLLIRTFYLENADAKTTLNLLKTMLKTKDAFVDEKLNLLVIRDTPDAIRLAEKLVAAHDLAEPEVVLEVEVIEVTHSKLTELGVKWTDRFNFGILDLSPGSFVLSELRGLNSNRITVNPPTASLRLNTDDGRSNVLATPRVRVKNREKARIMIGDRVPVISSQITPSSTNPVVTENVTYLDVGIKLEVEPTIHMDDDVAIRIGLDVSNLGERVTTQNGTIAYRVGTRNANTALRLKDGETQVLMGLIRDDERRAASRVPGIGELPVLSHLFGTNSTENTKTEIVLSITPRIVRNVRRVEARVAEFWSGTEATLRAQPQFARSVPAPTEAPAARNGSAEPTPAAAPAAAPVPNAPAPSGALQLSWHGPAEAKVGDEVTLLLRARTAETLARAAVQIGFDAATLEFVRIIEGPFMKQGGAATAMNHRLDAPGTLTVRFARSGGGASGEGELAAVTFRVREGAQTARVRTLAVSPLGPDNRPLALAEPPPHLMTVGP